MLNESSVQAVIHPFLPATIDKEADSHDSDQASSLGPLDRLDVTLPTLITFFSFLQGK
jgi:hypothetical protein